jgi:hypothetical protein
MQTLPTTLLRRYAIQGLAAASFVLAVAGRRVQSVLYALAFCLVQATGGVCQTAMRVMVVKQGIEVTDAGRAELNSAFAGLGKITQVSATQCHRVAALVPDVSVSVSVRLGTV